MSAPVLHHLFIAGQWRPGHSGETLTVIDPATEAVVGELAVATTSDLDEALQAAARGFAQWRAVSAHERSGILRRAADLLRAQLEPAARLLTLEQGKPLAEAQMELRASADIIDWYAEEGRRAYGRLIPARFSDVRQSVRIEPVGPVAAFTPWNFPVSQAVRKIAAALAAGCSIIIKGPEEAPGAVIALVKAFADAGLPAGVLNLVFGRPPEISAHLIASPIIRKVSFTGSVAVGKQLAALAASHMKPCTMELGGHAPVIVFDDMDPTATAQQLVASKFRNAGQVCVSPTRFYVQGKAYRPFVEAFSHAAAALKIGPGLSAGTQMGPLAHLRRLDATQDLIQDAIDRGAKLETGGQRLGNQGFFHAPTVLDAPPADARILHEEPFGPVAVMQPFEALEEVLAKANSSAFGLAAYVFSRSGSRGEAVADALESGMVSINHFGLALPETPFGGIKDSGYGREGGTEGLDAYTVSKFVSHKLI
ncbi:MAG: NAD-dependent succinate-semialdehyde dehydrogenase [Bosea sp. (in: a-proteobacteria)]